MRLFRPLSFLSAAAMHASLPSFAVAEENSAGVSAATSAPAVPAPAASPGTKPADRAVIAAWWENDFMWSDKYYTNGIKFAYTSPELFTDGVVPQFVKDLATVLPLASPDGKTPAAWRFHVSAVQEMYTPKKEYWQNPPLDDRPYAGVLYGSIAVSSETDYRLDVLELSLGVLGPSALGKEVQNNYHHFIGDEPTHGWDTQQHGDDPIAQLSWERRWRFELMNDESFGIDVVPHMHWEAGTIKIYGTGGAQFRFGWNLPKDFGTDFIRSTTGTTRPARNVNYDLPMSWAPDSIYFLLDLQGEGWAWNSTLDGSHWTTGRSVDRRPWVGQVAAGITARWGEIFASVTEVIRTKEFSSQDHVFVFSSLNIGYTF